MTERIIRTNVTATTTTEDPWNFYDRQMADFDARTPDEVATRRPRRQIWPLPSDDEVMQDAGDFQEMLRKFGRTAPAHHPALQRV